MNANETYAEMLEKLKRCLRLNYAGAFHMDILPACPNDQVGNGSIIVPDCKLECWMHSNPKGFAAWFFEKCRLRDELATRDSCASTNVKTSVMWSPVPTAASSADVESLDSTLPTRQSDSSQSRTLPFRRQDAARGGLPTGLAFSIASRFISRLTVAYRLVVLTLA